MFDPQLTPDQKEQLNRFVKEAYNYNKTHNLFVRDSEEAIYNKDIKDCWPALEHIKKKRKRARYWNWCWFSRNDNSNS